MTKKAAEARRQYKREWAKRNPEKIREYQERYWNKRAEETETASQPDTKETEERIQNNANIRVFTKRGNKPNNGKRAMQGIKH